MHVDGEDLFRDPAPVVPSYPVRADIWYAVRPASSVSWSTRASASDWVSPAGTGVRNDRRPGRRGRRAGRSPPRSSPRTSPRPVRSRSSPRRPAARRTRLPTAAVDTRASSSTGPSTSTPSGMTGGSPRPATSRRAAGTRVRHARPRREQRRETLAWLVDPAEEGDDRARRTPLRLARQRRRTDRRRSRWGSRPARRRGVAPVSPGPSPRPRSGRRSSPVLGAQHRGDGAIARDRSFAVWNVATTGTSAAHRASSDTLGAVGSCTCTRSNATVAQPPRRPGRHARSERDSGHRPVVRHRDGPARRARRRRAVQRCPFARREDADLVAAGREDLGQVADVVLHPSRHVEGVRAHQPDPHRGPPGGTLRRRGSVRGEHRLQHVPVDRRSPDPGREPVRHLLRHRRHARPAPDATGDRG